MSIPGWAPDVRKPGTRPLFIIELLGPEIWVGRIDPGKTKQVWKPVRDTGIGRVLEFSYEYQARNYVNRNCAHILAECPDTIRVTRVEP